MSLRGVAVLCVWGLVGCGAAPTRPPMGSLRLDGEPKSATVTIDDRYVGPLELIGSRGVALPEGQHRITVHADGFFPDDQVVEVRRGHPVLLKVKLIAVPQ